jgi:ribonucleoside-diphosphate reductase alpha chain
MVMCTNVKVIETLLEDSELPRCFSDNTVDEARKKSILEWEEVRAKVLAKAAEPCNDPVRWRLPSERHSITHHFGIDPGKDKPHLEGYITVGMYPSGRIAEVFVRIAKEGSLVSGAIDGFCTALSIALQHGIDPNVFVDKMVNSHFSPSGTVDKPLSGMFAGMPVAKSVLDYIGRYLKRRFPNGTLAVNGEADNPLRQLL